MKQQCVLRLELWQKKLLHELEIEIANHVVNFGGREITSPENLSVQEIRQTAGLSDLSIFDESQAEELRNYIDQIKKSWRYNWWNN